MWAGSLAATCSEPAMAYRSCMIDFELRGADLRRYPRVSNYCMIDLKSSEGVRGWVGCVTT